MSDEWGGVNLVFFYLYVIKFGIPHDLAHDTKIFILSFLCFETASSEMRISELSYFVSESTNSPSLKIFPLFALLNSKCSASLYFVSIMQHK